MFGNDLSYKHKSKRVLAVRCLRWNFTSQKTHETDMATCTLKRGLGIQEAQSEFKSLLSSESWVQTVTSGISENKFGDFEQFPS